MTLTRLLNCGFVLFLLSPVAFGHTPPAQQGTTPSLTLEIRLPKTSFTVGDVIPLSGKVTNISTKPLNFYADFSTPITFFVRMVDTALVSVDGPLGIWDPMWILPREPVRNLAPGASIEFTVSNIFQAYRLKTGGDYLVVGVYRISQDHNMRADELLPIWEGELVSKPITLHINDRAKPAVCRIAGRIKSQIDGLPLRDAIVRLRGTNLLTETDSAGAYHIDNVPVGYYALRVMGFGYETIDTVVALGEPISYGYDFTLNAECPVNASVAQRDIAQGKARLLIIGSIAPIASTEEDSLFEQRYGITYEDFGCTPPAFECVTAYNRVVFQYLDERFGRIWREGVRKDVVALNE